MDISRRNVVTGLAAMFLLSAIPTEVLARSVTDLNYGGGKRRKRQDGGEFGRAEGGKRRKRRDGEQAGRAGMETASSTSCRRNAGRRCRKRCAPGADARSV
jgi:hypothetical protein